MLGESENNTIDVIKNKLQIILDRSFKERYRKKIDVYSDRLNFACPVCGDSVSDVRKKRGNLYLDSLSYHCYNCGCHMGVNSLLHRFGEDLSNEDKIVVHEIQQNSKKFEKRSSSSQTSMSFKLLEKVGVPKMILFKQLGIISPYKNNRVLFYAESQRYKEVLENEQLHNRAYYDNLTRCKNRHALTEFLRENQYRWDKKDNVNLLMILFDIDNFKLYNDQFSHLGGDYCLRSICDAIRKEFPSPSLDFFRYGGEEFLLFFELKNPDDAPTVLEKVRESISNLDMVAPKGAPKKMVTISVGGMLLRNVKGFEFEHQMKIVDEYLYKAKNSGKDVVCYNGNLIN